MQSAVYMRRSTIRSTDYAIFLILIDLPITSGYGERKAKSKQRTDESSNGSRNCYVPSTPETTAENILHREFYADRPNEKWLTDVTAFKYYDGPVIKKLYLSAFLDLYDRRIVAYKPVVLGYLIYQTVSGKLTSA